LGIISGRGDHAEIKEKWGMDFSYRYDGEALKRAMVDFPNLERYVYVSDNPERKLVAENLGWEFVYPRELKAYEELGAEAFPFQVDLARLVLAVSMNIANFWDYYTTKMALEGGLAEGNPFARAIMRMGWRKYQFVKGFVPLAIGFQALTSEDPNYIMAVTMGVGTALFIYAVINNVLIMRKY